nr:PREDICTED: rab-like protein 6 [Lepisosteus oculatus]
MSLNNTPLQRESTLSVHDEAVRLSNLNGVRNCSRMSSPSPPPEALFEGRPPRMGRSGASSWFRWPSSAALSLRSNGSPVLSTSLTKQIAGAVKIVIRGDRNTGKSTLWHRLQGRKFLEEYIPTQEIQVTSIHWNYKTTDDVVKVEVWDVVDKGKSKKRGESLKLENEPQEAENELALDAEFLDVYKNCNGVIMMFDITKQWTFNYILRELPKVPTHVPVCVLGNHRDMGEHRVILPDDIRDFIASLNRPLGSSYIHYAESSMKNGFGLKYLHRFFNIPFLQLQRETLLRQLETNQLDIDATLEELTVQQETEDQNYNIFTATCRELGVAAFQLAAARWAGGVGAALTGGPHAGCAWLTWALSLCSDSPAPGGPEVPARVQSVDDFVPDEGLDRGFLEDSTPSKGKQQPAEQPGADSDSDGEARGGNPMVAGFQDDLDPDDKVPQKPPSKPVVLSKDIALSSEEEEEEGAGAVTDKGLDRKSDTKRSSANPPRPDRATEKTPPPRGPKTDPVSLGALRAPAASPAPPARPPGRKKGGEADPESSDTDPEGPVAKQMLSFIMDDPDFDSEESDNQITKETFPVREDVSDLSDDDLVVPSKIAEPLKPAVLSFKPKNDADLFGLGIEENPAKSKGSSEDVEGRFCSSTIREYPFLLEGSPVFPVPSRLSQ